MAHPPRLALLVRARRRRVGWQLASVLALLGVLLGAQRLGWHRLTQGTLALSQTVGFLVSVGWLLLLLAAAALALGLMLRSRRGAAQWVVSRRGRWVVRLFVAITLAAVVVLVVVVVPPRFTAHRHFATTGEELKAQNDIRATLLQALAGALLATGAYLTFRQLLVTREGQITDRYTKAVDQLGSEHLDVRVGGIYALERIARDSSPDRSTIEEVLTAFVRDHAPWPPPPASPSLQAITHQLVTFAHRPRSVRQRRAANDTAGHGQPGRLREQGAAPPQPPTDVQAAARVLGRLLPPDRDDLPRLYLVRWLDLTRVELRGAELSYANLQRARLSDANLQDARLDYARLDQANLQRARLDGADLQGARLGGTDLQSAWLDRANLQGARLDLANLQGARLSDANLQGTRLSDANLQGTRLSRANLQDADLQRARLDRANLQGTRLSGANLQGAVLSSTDLQDADLSSTDLQDARADEDTRWPAGWDRTVAEGRGVRYLD